MKKSELILLFITMIISVVIIITTLFYFIKPSRDISQLKSEDSEVVLIDKKTNNGWLNRITKQNKTFSYPVVIYKLD